MIAINIELAVFFTICLTYIIFINILILFCSSVFALNEVGVQICCRLEEEVHAWILAARAETKDLVRMHVAICVSTF